MHLNFSFERALHLSTLAIKLFNSSTRLFQATIATATVFLQTVHHLYDTPTFKTKVLHLVGNLQLL